MKTKYRSFYTNPRNYGCRYRKITENGYRALILENEKIRISIYLDKGSDIYELLYKPLDIDFMWRSTIEMDADRITPLTREHKRGSFLDIYEGGWQDLLPSIGAPNDYKNMDLGTHGELFSLPFNMTVIENNPERVEVLLSVMLRRAPLYVEKYISIRSGSPVLYITQKITNKADEEFKFSWGQHPAIGVPFLDEDCVIDVPESGGAYTYYNYLSENRIIPIDKEFDWPYIESLDGKRIDLSRIMSPEKKTAYITYLKNIKEGWYGITNLDKRIGFGMVWDNKVFKHLWMWMVFRGYSGYPWYGRTYNIALEPWSSLPDKFDEVLKNGDYLLLGPGESLKTDFRAAIYESGKRIKGFNEDMSAKIK